VAERRSASVRTPLYVRDNIHIDLLAAAYAAFAQQVPARPGISKLNPSFYVESQGAFANRFATEMQSWLNVACPVNFLEQVEFGEPWVRVNTDRIDGSASAGTKARPGWRSRALRRPAAPLKRKRSPRAEATRSTNLTCSRRSGSRNWQSRHLLPHQPIVSLRLPTTGQPPPFQAGREKQRGAHQGFHWESPNLDAIGEFGCHRKPRESALHTRRRRAPSSSASALLIMNSSILWPVLSAAVSHRGRFPRPDQVSEGSSGFRYLG
jgi:hypothetical protein